MRRTFEAKAGPRTGAHTDVRERGPQAPTRASGVLRGDRAWWRDAVIYQIYIRSFADSDGDGIGDLDGSARACRTSPTSASTRSGSPRSTRRRMADGGYDVADYRDIDPLFGTLADADALIADAHALGIRVIIDLVPNHTSDQHAWFQAALAPAPGSAGRARYLFRPGRGAGRRAAAERLARPCSAARPGSGSPDGEWYLHLFAAEQPDLDWTNPEVRAEFESTPAVLARPRRRRLPHRRRPRAGQGPGPARPRRPADPTAATGASGTSTRTGTATRCTTSTAAGAASSTSYPHEPMFVAEAWVRDAGAARALRAARRAAHGLQLRPARGAVGRGAMRAVIDASHARGSAASVRRRRGCSRTTT